jgi:pilus assembly protein CpaF
MTESSPIDALLADKQVSDIFINGYDRIYFEKTGKVERWPAAFSGDDTLREFVLGLTGGATAGPCVDLRLPDGSRMNVVFPPAAVDGIYVSIRKPVAGALTMDDLVSSGSVSTAAASFLKDCVEKRKNIVVSGGTGSGKTTLLNVLSSFIDPNERIITIEDAAELRLLQEHVVRLEARAAGGVTIRQLVANSLRMRPDRIIVGECRGGEALDMLQAMNTGHDGSMTTVHANTPRDALKRIEVMCLMSGLNIPIRALREQASSAVDFIVQVERRVGVRRVSGITQVCGMEGDVVTTADIFRSESGALMQTGFTPE